MKRTYRLMLGLMLVAPGLLVCILQFTPGVPVVWAEISRFVPWPWLLCATLMALALAWRQPWWYAVLVMADVALIAWPLTGLRLNSESASDARGQPIKVMTFNTKSYKARWRAGGLNALATEIRSGSPDVVALQDADALIGDVANPLHAPLRAAPGFLGFPYAYAAGQYALASRYPLRGCKVADLGRGERSHDYLSCELDVNGVTLTLVTAHFISPRYSWWSARRDPEDAVGDWRSNLAQRLHESQVLAQGVAQLPRPVIVLGDFNAPEESPVVDGLLALGLVDTHSVAGLGWGFTYGHSLPGLVDFLRIDHILMSPELDIIDSKARTSLVSDHNAVIATLLIPHGS